MDQEEHGNIPRKAIKWFPSIDQELCTQCGACVEFCHRGVFAMNDHTEVANPYSCVVGCSGCRPQCPEGAISFPTLAELRELLKELRNIYSE